MNGIRFLSSSFSDFNKMGYSPWGLKELDTTEATKHESVALP